jgi:glycosyltransferase involved in cell wall biosynthesis
MKIIVVHNQYQRPGGEDVVFDQERQLLERAGHHVVVYGRSNWEVESYSGIRRLALARRTIWADDTRRDFAELLRREHPDLVHIHNTFVMISPSIYPACREVGVPVVQTLHNYRFFCPAATFFRNGHICEDCVEHSLWRSVLHSCYRDSKATTAMMALTLAVHRWRHTWTADIECYISLSQFSRDTFVRAGLPAEKIFVKPNFVDPDPGIGADGGDYAVFVGRLSPEKRVSTVLAAWNRLGNRIPLLIIGGGPERAQLEAEATQRGLTAVRFQGQLSREQTLAAIRGARVLVFTSEWYENFPVTIAESFACGVPVICSRLGAMQEIVEDGRTGLHFTPGNAQELAEKITWAWNHPEEVRLMGKEARHEYESKYTAERNYRILLEIYQRAVTRCNQYD